MPAMTPKLGECVQQRPGHYIHKELMNTSTENAYTFLPTMLGFYSHLQVLTILVIQLSLVLPLP